jgi:hypothetical protein
MDTTPAPVQLSLDEYIMANLSDDRAFILHADSTGEMIIIQPASHPTMKFCDECQTVHSGNHSRA